MIDEESSASDKLPSSCFDKVPVNVLAKMEECSVNGDSGAEEDEDEELSQASGGTESSTESSETSTTTDSGEESADDQGTTTSETNSSMDEDEDESNVVEHPEEQWETCIAGGTKVKLPQDLCEHAAIFKEMLDYPKFWDECLSESQKESLYSFLPTFPKDCNIEAELDKTLDMLFKRETHRFGVTPLDDFHNQLSAGYFRPDMKKIRSMIKKARRKKSIFLERKRSYELTQQILKSRANLLYNAYNQGYMGQITQRSNIKSNLKKPMPTLVDKQAQRRYKEELNAINAELGSGLASSGLDTESSSGGSDDDDDGCCLLTPGRPSIGGKLQQQLLLLKQQQRRKKRAAKEQKLQQLLTTRAMQLKNTLFNGSEDTLRPVCSTLQRLGNECGPNSALSPSMASTAMIPEPSEESYKAMLIAHKKRRARGDTNPELNTQSISLPDLVQRAQLGQKHKLTSTPRQPGSKKRMKIETPYQPQQVPAISSVTAPNFVPKMESDAMSHTSGDYSLPSADELRHNAIEMPDEKPPECIFASEVPDVKCEIKIEDCNEHKYEIATAIQKYEIEPPADQPPSTIMDDGVETDHNEMSSPMAVEIKEELDSVDYDGDIKLEAGIVSADEIEPTLTLPSGQLTMPMSQLQLVAPNGADALTMSAVVSSISQMNVATAAASSLSIAESLQLPMSLQLPVVDDDMVKKEELDLDSIDMMQLPIQLDDGIDILADVNVKCEDGNVIAIPEKDLPDSLVEDIVMNGDELLQETHACFFSLLRDVFMSKGAYRLNVSEMTDSVMLWQDNPISPLNDWYSLFHSWPALVPLALSFLAGEMVYPQDPLSTGNDHELVPYLENKGQGVYAWIGAGRDSDNHLAVLCAKFLLYKDILVAPKSASPIKTTSSSSSSSLSTSLALKTTIATASNAATAASNVNSPSLPSSLLTPSSSITATTVALPDASMIDNAALPDGQSIADGLAASLQPEWEPPQALYPTDWKVRPSTAEEKEVFRKQERMRYAAPHKAYTYHMHGYSSVVGPVKGIYQHNAGSALTKARGHSLLVPDRPNFVTILALVRDATARLPNGEGTRADICMLLKDSQYIHEDIFANDKESNLNSVVSGALDRLHYENDPCVRYYPKRKEWLYLHRARSESEFELYHQQLQGVPKNKKSSNSASRSKAAQAGKNMAKDSSGAAGGAPSTAKESTPKKEKKGAASQASTAGSSAVAAKKELPKKIEEKVSSAAVVVDASTLTAEQQIVNVIPSKPPQHKQLTALQQQKQQQQQQSAAAAAAAAALQQKQQSAVASPQQKQQFVLHQQKQQQQQQQQAKSSPAHHVVITTATAATTTTTTSTEVQSSSLTNTLSAASAANSSANAPLMPSVNMQHLNNQSLLTNQAMTPSKECPVTVISTVIEPKQHTVNASRDFNNLTNVTTNMPTPATKKLPSVKSVAMSKSGGTQSLLQANQPQAQQQQQQQHFTPQQIQVSTSAGLQTIRLSGHSVLQTSAQPSTSVTTLFSTGGKSVQSQAQIITAQPGKSLLQSSNLKQQHQQQQQQQQAHAVSGKTLLTSQIKLVSSNQIKSLLTGHGLSGQTIFIKQAPSASTTQAQSSAQSTVNAGSQSQVQQRVLATSQQGQQSTPNMQRIIAQIGGKPIAVQIQQSPQQQQQQSHQKVLAKMLTTSGSSGQLISVESLLAQKGLKLATTNQARSGGKVIQTQYQVVSQAQSQQQQQKIIVSSQSAQALSQAQAQLQSSQQVRMVTAQLAGKPIVLTSGPGAGKTVNVSASGNVVIGKQANTSQAGQQQPIILPGHQLLNLKTLHGLKVISPPTGLKTASGAVYARVIAPSSLAQAGQSNVVIQSAQAQQIDGQAVQNSRNSTFGGAQ
ncbi:hypothetical protein TKK_0007536 [Trichogramma kaykai]